MWVYYTVDLYVLFFILIIFSFFFIFQFLLRDFIELFVFERNNIDQYLKFSLVYQQITGVALWIIIG